MNESGPMRARQHTGKGNTDSDIPPPWRSALPNTKGPDTTCSGRKVAGRDASQTAGARCPPTDTGGRYRGLQVTCHKAICMVEIVIGGGVSEMRVGPRCRCAGQDKHVSELSEPIAAAAGIARWKADEISTMLWDAPPAHRSIFAGWRAALDTAERTGGAVAIWPSRVPADFEARAAERHVAVCRLEDGFIRSIGLGSDCTPPASIVVDRRGIYYDASRASDLEVMIEAGNFSPQILARADTLMARMVQSGLGKYEVGRATIPLPQDGRRRVLVAGQVEDDLSVLTSGCGVAGNIDLLRRARVAEPEAMVIYRPHPDVDQGHRKGRVPDDLARRYADIVVREGTMTGLIEQVDAVHVLTSLAGFEALMRGKAVTAHGHPFYAGWGLTTDLAGPVPRRTRRATLSELGAAALILYPRYMDPLTGKRCSAEKLVDRLASPDYRPRLTVAMRYRHLQARANRYVGKLRTKFGIA